MPTGEKDLRLVVDFQRERIEVLSDGSRRIARTPSSPDRGLVTTWPVFLSIVVAATGRPSNRQSGADEWWELELDPATMTDSIGDDIPPFSLARLTVEPFLANNSGEFLSWYVDHHGNRDSEGHSPGCGDPLAIGEEDLIWLGGSVTDDYFDLYEQAYETASSGRDEGFSIRGRWVGRFITHPDEGEYKAEFYAPTEFKRPGFSSVDWAD